MWTWIVGNLIRAGGCRSSRLGFVLLAVAVVLGCAQAVDSDRVRSKVDVAQVAPAGNADAPAEAADPRTAATVERKIIYTATVGLVVEDFDATDRKIQALTQEAGGFVAEFREDRSYGDRQAGRWVVRIPTPRFQEFLDQVVTLGVPETRQIDAQDVTEEYVDLEARIANKKKLEQRILDLLENQTGEIKDVIAVETELARVREEIERMEGRLRFLANRVELTTITITAREEQDYIPPQAPSFTGKVRNVWSQSLTALRQAGEALVLTAVALAPWLVVLAVLGSPFLIWFVRWRRRR